MTITKIAPRVALNKSYLKVKPNRSDIERFKINLIELLDQINEKESEEFHKNIISKFLDKTYYSGSHYINTKGRNDLVIHLDKDSKSNVGVIIETKQPTKKNEMVQVDKLNTKAFQELVLYYMRERISEKNLEVKNLIITNIYEWFIFDVDIFEKAFAQNIDFVKRFVDFEEKRLSGKNTDFFYKEIAEPAIDTLLAGNTKLGKEVFFTHFDIREYESIVRNQDKADDNKLISLFKLLSPEHLLKLPFKNDSNSLDKGFYSELLHIIGLVETKDGGKKLIGRKKPEERHEGSLIENIITQLESLNKLTRLDKPSQYGTTDSDKYFNVALELAITWVNRILFLKLLEAQLLAYNKDNKEYAFLNSAKIQSFDDLNSLFFQVLAREPSQRSASISLAYKSVPYLNSSLFEPTDLEQQCFPISQLEDSRTLPILSTSVLKDNKGKRKQGDKNTLEYLFSFLDSYDFSGEGSEEIQEENKTLINAAVLGLIFEKINGYKDGSFFTPGYITMYMSREVIRRAVIDKFNSVKGWSCQSIYDIYNKITDKSEANRIINDIKIIDPAVGSGHFLVSALNEIIALKSDLKILIDRTGKTLRDYKIIVSNDELSVFDENGELFEYNPKNQESQRVQETLFHEKQKIIESCLFGVDINANSVKICRLRLWIELLKNAYYRHQNNLVELETLPNIDINIKCGNSLISRHLLDVDLSQALKKAKITINEYKDAVQNYRHATSKEEKREMENLIAKIKGDFRTEISNNDPKIKRLRSKRGEYDNLVNQHQLFKQSSAELKTQAKRVNALKVEIDKIESQLEEIRTNKMYENAFEWRFEFPEVLNDEGEFSGFDIVIGNPPYIPLENFTEGERLFFKNKYPQFERKYETSVMFIVEGLRLLKKGGLLSYIAPVTWQTGENYSKFRKEMIEANGIVEIINLPFDTFEDAYVDTSIYLLSNNKVDEYRIYNFDKKEKAVSLDKLIFESIPTESINEPDYKLILDKKTGELLSKYSGDFYVTLGSISKSTQGLAGSLFPRSNNDLSENVFPFLEKGNVYNYALQKESVFNTDLSKKPSLKQFYEAEPKLLIRRIINRQDRLSVGYTEERLVFKKDINPFIITDQNFSTKYVLGLLASRFISRLYLRLSSIANKDDFRQTTLGELRKLPIPRADAYIQEKIGLIVDKILKLKGEDIDSNTDVYEEEIEHIVAKLYDER